MIWSKYQEDIFESALDNDCGSFVVSAVAGSGKTSTITECARRIAEKYPNKRILFLAFNKSIVEELNNRLGDMENINCNTLHGFGLKTLFKSKMNFIINENKWFEFIRANVDKMLKTDEDFDRRKKFHFMHNCDELLKLCRINLINFGNTESIETMAKRYHILLIANEVEVVNKLLAYTKNMFKFKTSEGIVIDYTDMITYPLFDNFRRFIFKYDYVFIDEAQDLSAAQQELMLYAVKPTGKFIAVGDPSQAINGFAGAMVDSFHKLEGHAKGNTYPLSVCYRCGKNIITEAQKIVKEIEPAENAEDGSVIYTTDMIGVNKGDMVVCRKTAPLVLLCEKMMGEGLSAYIKGKDIATSMIEIIENSGISTTDKSIDSLYVQLDNLLNNKQNELIARGYKDVLNHPIYLDLYDKVLSIKTVGANCTTVEELYKMLNKMFSDSITGDAIMLSTVHRAKGLERDNVYIICPELLPHRFNGQTEWEYQQEVNLKYVALTRAKKKLYIVGVTEKDVFNIVLK